MPITGVAGPVLSGGSLGLTAMPAPTAYLYPAAGVYPAAGLYPVASSIEGRSQTAAVAVVGRVG